MCDPILNGLEAGLTEVILATKPGVSLPIPVPHCSLLGHTDHVAKDCPLRRDLPMKGSILPGYYRQFAVPAHIIKPATKELAVLHEESERQKACTSFVPPFVPFCAPSPLLPLEVDTGHNEAEGKKRTHQRNRSICQEEGDSENFYEEIDDGDSFHDDCLSIPQQIPR